MKNIRKLAFLAIAGMLLMTWVGPAAAEEGQKIFMMRCAACHGDTGKGDGPLAKNFDPRPKDFRLPGFWQGDVNKKISDAITQGKNQMVPIPLTPDQIKQVTDYIKSSFKS